MITQQALVDRVIETLIEQVNSGDLTVLEELLGFIPTKNLIGALNEDEWATYKSLK